MKQRGFTRTGRSDNGDKLAFVHGKGHMIQRLYLIFTFAVCFAEVFNSQYFHCEISFFDLLVILYGVKVTRR